MAKLQARIRALEGTVNEIVMALNAPSAETAVIGFKVESNQDTENDDAPEYPDEF